jgi:hypothetical protein
VSLRFPSRATASAVVFVAVHLAMPHLAASVRSPRAALGNDGVMVFLVFLVLLLAISLVAVVRLPPWAGGPADEDAPARRVPAHVPAHAATSPGTAWPAPTGPQRSGAPAAVRPPGGPPPAGAQPGAESALSFPAATVGPYGGPDPAAGPAHRPVPAPGAVRSPVVSGSPPWGPAPKPPDMP